MSVDLAVLEVGYSTDHVPDALLAQSWYETARDGAATVRPLNPCTTAVIAGKSEDRCYNTVDTLLPGLDRSFSCCPRVWTLSWYSENCPALTPPSWEHARRASNPKLRRKA